jgi:MFS family permease
MPDHDFKLYKYRWVVLAVYVLISIVIEIQWLTFAPVASAARAYYKAAPLQIDLLSMLYMIIFIVFCIPASYVIDTYGLKKGLWIGAGLTGIFGLMKGVFASDYVMVLIAQTGLAVAQPFILNALTKIGVTWFPLGERATAVGLGTLAQYVGIIVAMVLTPHLIASSGNGIFDLKPMLMIYGIASLAAAAIFLVLMRDHPPTPPSASEDAQRSKVFEGMRSIFKNRDMLLMLAIFFLGLGMFNAISTCIEQVCRQLTIEQAGLVGGMMLFGGIVGAVILPAVSDKIRRRKPIFVVCTFGMLPGIIGLTVFSGYFPLLISGFIFGFFMMSAGPIGFQYGAELSRPAPESTAQGLLLLAGQISGILFVFAIDKAGIGLSMMSFIIMTAAVIFFSLVMKESPMFRKDKP